MGIFAPGVRKHSLSPERDGTTAVPVATVPAVATVADACRYCGDYGSSVWGVVSLLPQRRNGIAQPFGK